MKALSSHHSMSDQMLQDGKVFDEVADVLLHEVYSQARGAEASPV